MCRKRSGSDSSLLFLFRNGCGSAAINKVVVAHLWFYNK